MEKNSGCNKFPKMRILLFILLLLACVCMMAYIFRMSSMTLKQSAMESEGLVQNLKEYVASQNGVDADELSYETGQIINIVVRKTAHFVLFALFGVLTYFLFACVMQKKYDCRRIALYSVSACVIYAISDEIHQTFVEGRKGRLYDVAVDSAGVIAGTLVAIGAVILYRRVRKYVREKHKKQ